MAITMPYSTANTEYGTITWSSVLVLSDADAYEYRTMTSQGYYTLNSITKNNAGSVIANIYYYSYSLITRWHTGYAVGTYTFQSTPFIRINNPALGSYINIYNGSLTTTVADAANGSITHAGTINVTLPEDWLLIANRNWNFTVQQTVTCVNTGETITHVKTEPVMAMPPIYNVWVNDNGVLKAAIGIWTNNNGVLREVKNIGTNYNGALK